MTKHFGEQTINASVISSMSNSTDYLNNQSARQTDRLNERGAVKILAPDDIEVNQYVVLMSVEYEIPTYMWPGLDHMVYPIEKPIKISVMPCWTEKPIRVLAICYPFVLCQNQHDVTTVLDLRQTRLGLVDETFAALAFKNDKHVSGKRRSKKKKGKKNKAKK